MNIILLGISVMLIFVIPMASIPILEYKLGSTIKKKELIGYLLYFTISISLVIISLI